MSLVKHAKATREALRACNGREEGSHNTTHASDFVIRFDLRDVVWIVPKIVLQDLEIIDYRSGELYQLDQIRIINFFRSCLYDLNHKLRINFSLY